MKAKYLNLINLKFLTIFFKKGYEEYLTKLESMLSRKALSIRDLQSQICQLKNYHSEEGGKSNLHTAT